MIFEKKDSAAMNVIRSEAQRRLEDFTKSIDFAPYKVEGLYKLVGVMTDIPFIKNGEVFYTMYTSNFGVIKLIDAVERQPVYVIGMLTADMFVPTYKWLGKKEQSIPQDDEVDLFDHDHFIFAAGTMSSIINVASDDATLLSETYFADPRLVDVKEFISRVSKDLKPMSDDGIVRDEDNFLEEGVFIYGEEYIGANRSDFKESLPEGEIPRTILNAAALPHFSFMTQTNLRSELVAYLSK